MIKEAQSTLKRDIQFIDKPHHLINKVQELKFLLLVLRSSIYSPHMQEVVKLDFSVVLESEKLSSFKNSLITSLKLTVVIQSLPESVKEQERVTICIMK